MANKNIYNTYMAHTRDKGITFTKPTKTQRQFGYECDINNIVKGCVQTIHGQLEPKYIDVTSVPDLETSLKTVADARSQFEKMPSNVRARFENDPMKLLKFISNADNYNEALKLGLVNERFKPSVEPVVNPVVTPQVAGGETVNTSSPSA